MKRATSGKVRKNSKRPARKPSTGPGSAKSVRLVPKAAKSAAPAARVAARVTKVPAKPHWTERLSDGTHVIVRTIEKRDAGLEREFIERLSPEARRTRFFGGIGSPSDDLIRRLTDIDYRHDMAFIALVHRDGKTLEVGVSRYSLSADGKFCECAVTVSDEWRHRGLATLLMRHLIDTARARGIRKMVSYDLATNVDMRQLADSLGFVRQADPADATLVIHSLDL